MIKCIGYKTRTVRMLRIAHLVSLLVSLKTQKTKFIIFLKFKKYEKRVWVLFHVDLVQASNVLHHVRGWLERLHFSISQILETFSRKNFQRHKSKVTYELLRGKTFKLLYHILNYTNSKRWIIELIAKTSNLPALGVGTWKHCAKPATAYPDFLHKNFSAGLHPADVKLLSCNVSELNGRTCPRLGFVAHSSCDVVWTFEFASKCCSFAWERGNFSGDLSIFLNN